MARDYKFILREFDKYVRILEAEGNYPPSIQDIEFFCKETITKRFWYYPPTGGGVPSQMFLGIYSLDQRTSEKILDITDGISNSELLEEMRNILIERATEIYGELGTNNRNREWEPAPYTIEQRAFDYAIEEGYTRDTWNALSLVDMQGTPAYQKALSDAIFTANQCTEYFKKVGPFMLEKTMHHPLASVYFSFSAKLADQRKSTLMSRPKGETNTVDSEQDITTFMKQKQYEDVISMGNEAFRALWWTPSITGQNMKMGCIDIDNPANISDRRTRTLIKGFCTKLENDDVPYIIMFTGNQWQIWFGTNHIGDIVSFQEVNTYIREELAKGLDVVVGRGPKAIEEAQIRERALIDESVNDKNSMLGMFFGMHYKPQYRPTDKPGTGLVRVPVTLSQLSTFDPIIDAHPENVMKEFSSLSLLVDEWFAQVEIGSGYESKGTIDSEPSCMRSADKEESFETTIIAEKWKKGTKFHEYDFPTARTELAEEPELIITPKLDGWLGVLHYRATGGFKLGGKRLTLNTTRLDRRGKKTATVEEVNTVLVTSGGIVMWDNHITREYERVCKQGKLREAIITGELISYDEFGKVSGPAGVTSVINRKETTPTGEEGTEESAKGEYGRGRARQNPKMFSKLRFASHDLIKLDGKEFAPEMDYREKNHLLKEFDTFRVFAIEYHHLVMPFNQRFDSLWEQITVTDGHEGLVVYTKDRRVKVKRKFTVDGVIIGIDKTSKRWIDGKGIGSAYVAVTKKRPKYGTTYVSLGRVGTTGLTDEERMRLTEQVLGEDNANVIPVQQTIEKAMEEEETSTGLEDVIFVEPTTVVEVQYETLLSERKATFSIYRRQASGKGARAKTQVMLVEKPVYARRMRSSRIVNIRDDKNALNNLDVSHEQGETAGGFKIGARPNPAPEPKHIQLPYDMLEKFEQELVLSPRTADKQMIPVKLEIEQLVTRSFVGKVHRKNKFQAPIDMWRKLYRLMDRRREFIGFVKNNEIHYGSSHVRGAVNMKMHRDVIGCDFMFHTHPYSKLFKTELGFMSPADLNTMAFCSLGYDIDWHVIVEQYGFECIRTVPQKPLLDVSEKLIKAWKKKDHKALLKHRKKFIKMIKEHRKIVINAYRLKTSNRRKLMKMLEAKNHAFTPFDISAAVIDEINSKSKYFQYEYYTLPLPLYSVDFKGDYPQIEALNNPAFYGYEPKRMVHGHTPADDKYLKIQDEFDLAYRRAYAFDKPPGDQKMYLFGAGKQGYTPGHQPTTIRGKSVYLDATNLSQSLFAHAIYDDFGEGQDAAKILPKYDSKYTTPKSWYDIEKSLYHADEDQEARDMALGIRVAFDAGKPTETLEPEEFYNKWFENLEDIDEELKDTSKESKLTKEEKRKLVKVLDDNIENNPAFVTPDWETKVNDYIEYYDVMAQTEGPQNLDSIIKSKLPRWEYEALEKARKISQLEQELQYTEEEISMIKQSFSPQTSSVTLTSAFSSLYGPSLFGDIEEEDEDDETDAEDN